MDIITYHVFESDTNQNDIFTMPSIHTFIPTRKKNENRHTPHRVQGYSGKYTAAAADARLLFSHNEHNLKSHNTAAIIRKVSSFFLHIKLIPLCIAVCAVFTIISLPLIKNMLDIWGLTRIHLPAESSCEQALYSYIFPEELTAAANSKNGSTVSFSDYIPLVTFRSYIVKKGETISGIAARAGLRHVSTLLSVNGITNARRVSSGQKLRIPSIDGLAYTVKKNDSLAGIAEQYNVKVTALLDANDLPNSALTAGQELFIPGAVFSASELRQILGEVFIYPIKGRLTSPFGYRSDPFTGVKSFHSGIDLAAPTGTPVKSTLDGKVVEAGINRIFGNYVIISHDRGYQSLYGHLHTIYAKRGQSVTQGTVIGTVGTTGYSTGPHLHLSIYKNGKMIDPFSVLK
ncbi:MAG: peptidoglycan DD-metalloendopeptidase family protein [Treponema sp.]